LELGCWKPGNFDAGIAVVGGMKLIIPPYSAMAIQARGRAISCKRECITAGNQIIVFQVYALKAHYGK